MKRVYYIFLFFIAYNFGFTQDNTWIKDITNQVGLDSAIGSRIWLGDFNNDNYTDLLWGTPKATHNNYNLMINKKSVGTIKRFLESLPDNNGFNYNKKREGSGKRITDIASMADFDNNGTLDILASIYYHRFTGYKDANDPGDRTEVFVNDGKLNFSLANSGMNNIQMDFMLPKGLINATGIGFLDFNLDGLVDAYISTWFTDYYGGTNDVKQRDILFRNTTSVNDVKFERESVSVIDATIEPMYGVNITDWNNDGWQDIVTSPYCRTGGSIFAGGVGGTFRDATAESNYSAQHLKRNGPGLLCQWEANPGDFDNDGDMDILQVIVHGGYYGGMGRTVIAVNQGKDKNYRLEWGIDRIRREAPLESHLGDMGACWWDIDNDGWLDMAIGQMSYPTANLEGQERLYILRQNDSGYFDDISKKLGIFYSMKEAHSMEPYDYDMDGDHDLIFSRQVRDTIEVDTVINGKPQKIKVQNVYMKVHLLENNIGNKNNWIGMKLNPPKGSNRSGIGSRIHIWSEGLCQMRDLQAGIGHFANQQSFIQLAGIGQRNRVDSVIIRWQMPGFPESKFYDLPINTYLGIDSSSYKFLDTWTANQDLLSPNIAFESTFLDFGKVNKGESNELSFYIKFPDTVDDFPNLKVDSIKLNSAIFEIIANPAPFIITKGERKEVKVKFTPDQRANYNAKIEIFSNASNGKLRKYDLYGFGFEPKPIISLSTEILDFDTVHIDTPKVKEIIIENIGEEELTVSNISFLLNPNEVFKLDGISLPFSLSAGESKVINISFHPIEYISYVGKLRISSNGFNSQQNTINIIGWGDGPKPELAVVETLEFGEIEIGKTIEKNLTLENSGGGVLEIKDLKIYINNDSAYQILDFKPPYTLVQNQKVDIKVAFSPKRAGTLSRPVDIYSSSYYGETKRMTFYGVGLEPSGTMEENTEKGTIYPNPAKDIVYVSFDSDKLLGDFKLQLFDESACEVSNFKYSRLCDCNNTYIINTSFLQTGSYRIFIKDSGLFFNEPIMILK